RVRPARAAVRGAVVGVPTALVMSAPYALRSQWVLPVGRRALWDVVERSLHADDPLPWWGLVEAVGRDGEALLLVAHSGLGYRLRFAVDELKLDRPSTMRFDVDGDVAGTGVLSFVPTGPRETTVVIDWNVRLTRRWMQRCDPVLR